MTSPRKVDVRAALAPSPEDGRLARLGKLAALSLVCAGRPVSRASIAEASKSVDDDDARVKRGFSESSLRTNAPLREVYEIARTHVPIRPLRRRGHVAAHIMRMTKAQIATALVVGRLAAVEREEEHRLASERLGEPSGSAELADAREARDGLEINVDRLRSASAPRAATIRMETAAGNAGAVARARAWAKRRKVRPTAAWLAERCGVHPSTVERLVARESAAAANARSLDFDVVVPAALLRRRKWDLGRALQIERDYIRALHAATMAIATVVIDREHLERRAAVKDGR